MPGLLLLLLLLLLPGILCVAAVVAPCVAAAVAFVWSVTAFNLARGTAATPNALQQQQQWQGAATMATRKVPGTATTVWHI